MDIQRLSWETDHGWRMAGNALDAALVLYFGGRDMLASGECFAQLRKLYPDAQIVGCTSASQIFGSEIIEDSACAVALRFNSTEIRGAMVPIETAGQSFLAGEELGRNLAGPDLAGVLVFSDGLNVNGTKLTNGISTQIAPHVPVAGGLAADGAQFERTLVGLNAAPECCQVVAIGFYGSNLRFCTGSAGGWSEFGPRRSITRSEGNVLFELDGEPALDLYERYLGEEDAKALPGSALLFPIKIYNPEKPEHNVVRTVLSVDHDARSMTFAGDMPQDWVAQFMRGTIDRLAMGAAEAARQIVAAGGPTNEETFVLMISCIGRRLLMGQRTVDEVDAVGEELGSGPVRLGFYSYGEICPHHVSGRGEMHNQTMTITAISEAG